VIFHDTTLREIAIEKPARLSQLKGLSGIGEKKLENYGAAIINVVSNYL
jgi:ATP-dependent DNA helicase RecQ